MHWGNILCRNRQDVGLHSVKHIEIILSKGHENQRRRITRQVLLYLYVYRRNGRVEYLSLVSNIDFVRLLFHVQLEEISLVWRRHYCKGLQNVSFCSAPKASEQGGNCVACHGALVFWA